METITETAKDRKGLPVSTPYHTPAREGPIPKKQKYTYKDYSKLPEGAPYQLIGGQLVMTPSPTPYHQEISRKLGFKIVAFVEEKKAGHVYYPPLDVYLAEEEVYQPDIIYIRKEREGIIGETKIEGAPDIVIEILLPSTAYYDLREKFRTYERYGVNEYWIVDPELRRIEIYENSDMKFELYMEAEKEGSVSSKILEGFAIAVDEVF